VNETVASKNNAKALVASYKAVLDPAMKDVGTPDPATGSFKAFTSLATDAASIKKGESGDAGVTKDAASVTAVAKASGGALAGVDIAKLAGTKSVPADVRTALTNSQKRLTQAFALYAHAASDLKDAAASTGAARAKSLASAQQLTSLADSLISDGYNDYSAARIGAGLQLDQATKSQLGQQAIPSGFPISSLPSGTG
jgi:hypothetical protein